MIKIIVELYSNLGVKIMDKRFLFAVMSVALLMSLFVGVASADVTATLRPPKMVLRGNVTEGYETILSGYFFVMNENNFTTLVKIDPNPAIADMIDIIDNVTLGLNETKRIDFNMSLTEVGQKEGDIFVIFSNPATNETPLALTVNVITVTQEGPCENCVRIEGDGTAGGSGLDSTALWIIIAVVLVAVVLLVGKKIKFV